MTEDVPGPIIAAAVLTVAALLTRAAIRAASRGDIAPNGGLGFRTSATRSSSEAWATGHRAGRRWMEAGTAVSIICAIATPLALLLPNGERVVEVSLLLSAGSLLVGAVGGGVVAHRAAREVQTRQGAASS